MGDGIDNDENSWTELEEVRPDLAEAIPIRHGMVLGGRYTIEKVLGRGGSGVVVRAHDRDLKEAVAIKIVRAELAGEQVWAARLAREVKLARQIQHPHVCRVFDFQHADGRVFLVMELASKGTLRDEIKSGALRARPLAERIADARAVSSALAAIHQAGIVHRDLTPQNLLRMADGRVVLTDFGLATDTRDGASSVAGGTVSYMAPEMLRGGRSSVGSDLWALGVVMYEIVFGEKPRWGEGPAPEMLAPELGRKLTDDEEIVLEACRACTVHDPAQRLQCPVEAGRRLTERVGRRKRRLTVPKRVALVAGLALTIVGGAAAIAVSMVRHPGPEQRGAQVATARPSPLIVPVGEPADWTHTSAVLVEVPERIHCSRLLRDGRTIRFVWGTPTRAEDIDTVTRARAPSPLVAGRLRGGLPGHFAGWKAPRLPGPRARRTRVRVSLPASRRERRRSGHPDGRAVDVVGADLAGGRSDLFVRHRRQTHGRLLARGGADEGGARRHDAPDHHDVPLRRRQPGLPGHVFRQQRDRDRRDLLAAAQGGERFRVPHLALDLRLEGRTMLFAERNAGRGADIAEIDTASRTARLIGHIPEQMLRYPMRTATGLAFISVRLSSDVILRKPNGALVNVTKNGHVWDGNRCGRDLIVSKELAPELIVIERLDAAGKRIEQLSEGPRDCVARLHARWQDLVLPAHLAEPEHPAVRSGTAAGRSSGASRSGSRRRRTAGGWRSSRWTSAARSCSGSAPTAARPHDVAETETNVPGGLGVGRRDLGVAPARARDRVDRSRRRFRPRNRQDRSRQPRLRRRAARSRVPGRSRPAHRPRPDVAAAA